MTTLAAGRPVTTASSSKALHVGLWVAQVSLAAAFALSGFGKATQPVEALAVNMPWVTALPVPLLRFIGSVEVVGALGLLLPALTRILPGLTPLAAVGLTTIMSLAIPFHLGRGEFGGVAVNVVLGGLAAFIAWGRFKKARIAPRR